MAFIVKQPGAKVTEQEIVAYITEKASLLIIICPSVNIMLKYTLAYQ